MVPPGDEDVEVEVADEPETVEVGGPEPLVEEVPANNPWNMSFRRGTYNSCRFPMEMVKSSAIPP